jgi:hypothetical protein
MVEVAAAISMAVSAYNGIKKAVEMGREAEDMAGYFAKFFDAKEALSQASLQNENTPLFKRVFSGKSVEAEALEITAAKHKAAKIEKELKEFLIYSGQSQFYDDMIRERRHIRQARIQQARQQAKRKKFWIDAFCIGVLLSAIFVMMGAIIQILIGAT